MLSDDVFRARLDAAAQDLSAWGNSLRTEASVEIARNPGYWKLALRPRVTGACPVEVLIGADQHYDLALDGESYEALPVTDLEIFLPLLQAVAAGHVIQRRWFSQATDTPGAIEMIVPLSGQQPWTGSRDITPGFLARSTTAWYRDLGYVPYHR